MGFVGEEFGYVIDLGLFELLSLFFVVDLQVKVEVIWVGLFLCLVNLLVLCCGVLVWVCDGCSWCVVVDDFSLFDSLFIQIVDFECVFEVLCLCEMMCGWCFYDYFCFDVDVFV